MRAKAHFDGGARGTPGPGSCAAVIELDDGRKISESKFFEELTSNDAEYEGLLLVVNLSLVNEIDELDVYSDSKLVVNQILNNWKTRNDRLRERRNHIQMLLRNFSSFDITHVPREQNKECDKLCRICMDENLLGLSSLSELEPVKTPFQNS